MNTTLPESVEAKIETFPRVDELVKLVLALPLAFVVAEATDSVPPLAVVTAKFTVKPDTAVPLEFVATISRGIDANVLGVTVCPLPEEMVMVDPVPLGMVFKLKTALPAVEEAMMASAPVCEEAVNVAVARPSAPVVAVAVVAEPPKVPAPEVRTLYEIDTPDIGLPSEFTAITSSDFAAVPCSTD